MKRLTLVLVALLALTSPALAQTYLSGTTLSSSITATQTQFAVASATGVQAGGALYVDHEFMDVVSVSGTTVTVNRAQRPQIHASGASVIVATAAQKAYVMRPTINLAGYCVLTDWTYLPLVDITTGNIYSCRYNASGATTRSWMVNNSLPLNGILGSVPTAWR